LRTSAECRRGKAPGEPYDGKRHVRFDEGTLETEPWVRLRHRYLAKAAGQQASLALTPPRQRPTLQVPGVREAIEAAGATLLYLPPYSPDLNPIEQAFSKLKAHLRKAAEHTVPCLLRRIGRLLASFSPQECRNFLHHAGYVRT
jgi:hypothetical protein